MSLVVAWLGVDTHGPSSAYIAADSRISWNNNIHYDYGRKVFAFNNSPDILGYCGDVIFPSIVLSQIIEMADCGLLFDAKNTSTEKVEIILKILEQSLIKYPTEYNSTMGSTFQVIYISRDQKDNKIFHCHLFQWKRELGWCVTPISLPSKSGILLVLGSGKKEFDDKYMCYQVEGNANTSRNVFHCFCDTLFNVRNPYVGGAPQLVGLIRKPESVAKKYGIIVDNNRYFFGAQIDIMSNYDKIEWRNDLFELCDGNTMTKKPIAQSQPNNVKEY